MPRKTKPCPSCGQPFRKGRIVLRIIGNGAQKQRVCQSCAELAVPVLAADANARCVQCGKNVAVFCRGCIRDAVDELATVKGGDR